MTIKKVELNLLVICDCDFMADFFPACKARGSDLRVHFKNTRETAGAIKHMSLRRANRFLRAVIDKKELVPFRRYSGGIGRKAQVRKTVSQCLSPFAVFIKCHVVVNSPVFFSQRCESSFII